MNSLVAKKDNHSKGPKDSVQAKLRVNEPGDQFEQEADAMADRVMTMRDFGSDMTLSQGVIGRSIQRKCAECESKGKTCASCEAREKKRRTDIFRKEASSDHYKTSNQFDAVLNSSLGVGQPLGDSTRMFMETAFSTDFSSVRIHTGQEAERLNKELNARAFTLGNDIFFANGQYSTQTNEGKKLLAHELTHVVQQNIHHIDQIQRQEGEDKDKDPAKADEENKKDKEPDTDFEPTEVIAKYLEKIEKAAAEATKDDDTGSIFDVSDESDKSDDEDLAWITNDPAGERKHLLLLVELIRASDHGIRSQLISKYAYTEPDGGTNYLTQVKAQIDAVVNDEKATLNFINQQISLGCTVDNFIDFELFQHENAANAFPDLAWNIVYPLISPPPGMDTDVPENYRSSLKNYYDQGSSLTTEMFYNGLPVSYQKSLGLEVYDLVKRRAGEKLNNLPNEKWVMDNYIAPEEFELHSDRFRGYDTTFANFVMFSFYQDVYNIWKEASSAKWIRFNTLAISNFRRDYKGGLITLDKFFQFEHKGAGASLGVLAQAIGSLTPINGKDPYKDLADRSAQARNKTPARLDALNAEGYKLFHNYLTADDERINQLTPNAKLGNAIEWSIEKGFAGESIRIMLENLDEILLDVLEEWAKQEGLTYVISTAVGWFGGPLGRLVSFVYNAYTKYNKLKGAVELALLVKSIVDVILDARNVKTIVQAQKAAAKVAEAYETIFTLIIQQVGNKVLDKLKSTAVETYKKSKKKETSGDLTDAKRSKLLDDTQNEMHVNKLSDEELNAEVTTANKAKAKEPYGEGHENYDAEIDLPNNHHWKRKKKTGTWCRSTDECEIPKRLTQQEKENLDQKAEEVAPKKKKKADPPDTETGTPEFAFPSALPYGMHIIDPLVKKDKPAKPIPKPGDPKPVPDPWKQAEQDLEKVLPVEFPDDEWEFQRRFRPPKVVKGTSPNVEKGTSPKVVKGTSPDVEKGTLGSTIPDAFSATSKTNPKVFEVKRLRLDEMGIGAKGQRLGPPSEGSIKALKGARGQFETRKDLISGAQQNIVFNVTGQTREEDLVEVGKSIKSLLVQNNVKYEFLWFQFKNKLIPIK